MNNSEYVTSIAAIEQRILACEACPAHLICPEWLPISYFGDICSSNAWIVSINPSQREFTDRTGNLLKGNKQRFHIVTDFADCRSRNDAAYAHAREVLSMQDTIFRRVPYRPYFNRLGRFLLNLHGCESNQEPLTALTTGAVQNGKTYLYAHLDVVKCATRQPWSQMGMQDRELLIANCAGHFEHQLRTYQNLELLLVNGKTAYDACTWLLEERLKATLQTQTMGDDSFRFRVTWGQFKIDSKPLNVVAWSSNVVRQRLRQKQYQLLVDCVQELLS